MHFYMGQAPLVLVGIYWVQMILRGAAARRARSSFGPSC